MAVDVVAPLPALLPFATATKNKIPFAFFVQTVDLPLEQQLTTGCLYSGISFVV